MHKSVTETETDIIIDLHVMKVAELKVELKNRKLPIYGSKNILIKRLEDYMHKFEGAEFEDDTAQVQPVEKQL